MTALNVMANGEAIVVFQDRASYDYEDGVIDTLQVKSRISEDGRWAMGFMGNGLIRPLSEATILKLPFDSACDVMEEHLRQCVEYAVQDGDDEPSAAFSIAGWSDRENRLIARYVQSWPWPVAKPFQAVEQQFTVNPQPFRDGAPLTLTADDIRLNWQQLGMLEFGRRLMELQRRPAPQTAAKAPGYMKEWAWKKSAIGGGCDATIVTKEGVRRQTLAEWPDAVGEGPDVRAARPINELPILNAGTTVVPMNRAERRRADRQKGQAA